MKVYRGWLTRSLQDDAGQAAVTYALILALVVIVAVASISMFGQKVLTLYHETLLEHVFTG